MLVLTARKDNRVKDTNTGEAANCRPKNDICLQIPPVGAGIQNVVPSWAELPPPLRSLPSKLFVETTTRCNLKCQSCVKQSKENGITEGDMSMASFMALAPVFPHLESLVLNGIGEPLLHPLLEDFMRIAKTSMPAGSWVGFQSNGTLLTHERADSLLVSGLDRICLSLDSVSSVTFKDLRAGGEVVDIENAIRALQAARIRTGKTGLEIGIEFVVSVANFRELPDVVKWAARHEVSFVIVTHLLPYDLSQAMKIAYEHNSDEALALFEIWKTKAEREEIDIRRYLDKKYFPFNWSRTREEERILDLVHKMMLDANRTGIFLQVKNLLSRDESFQRELAKNFNEARALAEEKGISLKLPEIVPKADRRCEFIETGSAMVSWDGNVYPCYLLWHKFNCYHKTRVVCREIEARSFGSLGKTTVHDIWNDPGFKAFREEVRSYAFSYCSNCNVAPCDFILGPEFENDCSAATVPCGDCFWCMGMFNCLQ
jgi:putative metalloenzyme radical SAM/SPASM domain maturase